MKILGQLTPCPNSYFVIKAQNHPLNVKMNADKTEFFIAASNHNLKLLGDVSLTIGTSTIIPSSTIRNLGVMFDLKMSMSSQVNAIV